MNPARHLTSTRAALGDLAQNASISPVNTPLTDRLESIINDMIDTASATVGIQENTFGRLFGYRPSLDAQSVEPPAPEAFEDRINIKLQRLQAAIREANSGAAELRDRLL